MRYQVAVMIQETFEFCTWYMYRMCLLKRLRGGKFQAFEDVFRKPSTYASENACFHDLLKLGTFSIWIIVRARLKTLEVDVIWKILGLPDSKHDFLDSILVFGGVLGVGVCIEGIPTHFLEHVNLASCTRHPTISQYIFWGAGFRIVV